MSPVVIILLGIGACVFTALGYALCLLVAGVPKETEPRPTGFDSSGRSKFERSPTEESDLGAGPK